MTSHSQYVERAIYAKHGPVFLLWACRETGVIETLLGGQVDKATLAKRTGITDRAAEIVLMALADLDYVHHENETYRATDRLAAFDPETSVADRGMTPHRIDSLERYLDLPRAMQTDDRPEFSPTELRNFVAGMGALPTAVVRAGVTAAERHHPRPQRVVDVGGGIGRFAREFATRGAAVTLVDHPGVIDLVRPLLADSDIRLVAGDARESLPTGFDLAFCGRLTEGLSPEENERLFENVFTALEPGGSMVCMDYVRGRSPVAALFAVHMLAMSRTGNTYTETQYHDWLEDAGFVDPVVEDVPGTAFQVTIGRKSS